MLAQTWSPEYPETSPAVVDIDALSALDVWVAGSDGELRHTTNGGVDWSAVQIGASALHALQFVSGGLGWCGGDGIWRSNDGGQTWQMTSPVQVRDVHFAASSSGLAVSEAGHALLSSNGGVSWFDAGPIAGLGGPTDVHLLSSGRAFAAGANGGLFTSIDFGASWSVLAGPTSETIAAVFFLDAQRGWIAAGATIWRTTNGGLQWTSSSPPTGTILSDVFFLTDQRGWACGANGTLLSSSDGGASWSAGAGASSSLRAIDAADFFNVWSAGEMGSVVKSSDGGANYAQVAGGAGVPAPFVIGIDSTDSLHAWAATFSSTILRTSNGGASWQEVPCGVNYQWWDVSFFDDLNGYACGKRQAFFPSVATTKDGGLSWNQIAFGLQMDWHDVEAIGPDTALIAGDTFVLRTTDGGLTWPMTSLMPFGTYYGMDFVDAQHGWVAGTQVFRTSDGGVSWVHVHTPAATMWDVGFAPGSEPFTGWAVGAGGTVMRTQDSGATWSASQIPGYTGTLLALSVVDASTLWVAGDQGFVARSQDGGATWSVETPALPTGTQLRCVEFAHADKGWISGSHDIGVWGRQLDQACPSPVAYCTAQVNSLGCTPAIAFSGVPSQSAGSGFVVSAANLIAQNNGVFFYSLQGADTLPFLGGTLCMKQPLVRSAPLSTGGSAGCSGLAVIDFNATIASGMDPALVTGQHVWGQFWTRDPAMGSTTNLTDALMFEICP